MMRNYIKYGFLTVCGGFLGSYLFIAFGGQYFGNILSSVQDPNIKPTHAAEPTPTPELGQWQKIISDYAQSSVAVHVFSDNQLVRQGSGLIVSSDGLVITTSDLAVQGGLYQVFFDDKIVKCTQVSIDYRANLMILKTDSSSSSVADLRDSNYGLGDELVLVGKSVDLSKQVAFSQYGSIAYIGTKIINIDTTYSKQLSGSATINSEGDLLGINYLRNGKILLINSHIISDFLHKFLDK